MTVIISTTDLDDPVTLAWKNHEHGDVYEVQAFLGSDGVTVVQVDAPARVRRVRINLNDGPVWDGDPDVDEIPGQFFYDNFGVASKGITLTRAQLEAWAGTQLTDDQVDELAEAIPNSSIPDAIETIVTEALGITDT